jgi:hypothetical protein
MNKNEPQTFETTEYSDPEFGVNEAHQAILQIFKDIARDQPAHAVWAKMSGDQLTINYHTYEMHLPVRMADIKSTAKTVIDESVKYLKKEFRARTDKALKLTLSGGDITEQTDRNYTVQKVSLNERYYYNAWRVFTVDI